MSDGMLGYGKADIVQYFLEPLGGRMATAEEIIANTTMPLAVAGITKRIVPDCARRQGVDWYCIDTGYFGNQKSHKDWWRVTRNEYQNSQPVQHKPDDRLKKLRIDRTQFRRGNRIVVIPTHPKVCAAWQLGDSDQWLESTIAMIRSYTDRPVVVRQRPDSRYTRQYHDRFEDLLRDDVHAVVAWTSNCLVEAAMHGIPVISLGASAAVQISNDITTVDNVPDCDAEQIEAWLRHLSYGQFTKQEMQQGKCWRILHG
jgi:hypothetical protein